MPSADLMPIPDVSVVIPAYNAERTLGETLASALAQTLDDLEVIVIDDGSTDATAAIAQNVTDKRVRVLSVPNGGVARARNRGMHEARGRFVAFLDADDIWRPLKLERQVSLLHAQPEVGMCFTAAFRVDADTRIIASMAVREYRDYCEALLLHSMVAGCVSSGVVRRALALDVGGFDPTFSQSADWDFWLRLSRVTEFTPVPEPLVLYRSCPGNMSSDVALLERDTFAVLDKFFADQMAEPYLPLRSRTYSNHWMTCSGSYLHAGEIRASLRCLRRGLGAYPANIRRPLGLPRRWMTRRTTTPVGPA
jgi:glycosyltransferase involved in cell wall biosynthesis